MKDKRIIYLLFLTMAFISLITGCSSSLRGTFFKVVNDIPSGKCLVYLYRPVDDYQTKFSVQYDNHEICTSEKGSYYPLFVDPGKVKITSKVNFQMFVTGILDKAITRHTTFVFTAQAGKRYFIECTTEEDNRNLLNMRLVTKEYGRVRIRGCRLLPKTERK